MSLIVPFRGNYLWHSQDFPLEKSIYVAQFANANMPPCRCSRNLRWSLGSGWRRPGIIRSALPGWQESGRPLRLWAPRRFSLPTSTGCHRGGARPALPSLLLQSLAHLSIFIAPPPPPPFFFPQIIPLWETRPENLPSVEEQQWGGAG